ncbi:MAG: hypothetical protein K6U88_11035 [Dehalococcoidia bacterium]|nr:hypothetical protein [Dehalococcoidia bacterium]
MNGRATRAQRPPADLPRSSDAYRQTSFVLGEEVDLVLEGLELEGRHAEACAGARYRNRVVAAVFGPWSRGWLARLQALHAAEWGDYSSAVILVRAAADMEAAAVAHLQSSAEEWSSWLDADGIADVHDLHASEFRLHPFRSAESLARLPALGEVYREASDFALPHFGSTALLTASDSNRERYLATFGDRDFHLGLAELVLGWLFRLGLAHWASFKSDAPLPPVPDGVGGWCERATRTLQRKERCRLERVEREGLERALLVNWRREPRSAPKRILL